MCGRFALSAKTSEIEKLVPGSKARIDWEPSYNIAPTQDIAVVLNDGNNEITKVRWGLIPFWAKDKSIGNKMINARGETLAEKPSFKNSFKKKRCLIYTDGFYEWKKVKGEKNKIPHFIKMADGNPFTFAGLWDVWKDKDNEDKKIISATIITSSPNELMAEIHDRMPVIIDESDRLKWLDPQENDPSELQKFIKPYLSELMEAYIVSTAVNNPRNNDPKLIQNFDQQLF